MASKKDPKKVAAIVGGGLLLMYLLHKRNSVSTSTNHAPIIDNQPANIRDLIGDGSLIKNPMLINGQLYVNQNPKDAELMLGKPAMV